MIQAKKQVWRVNPAHPHGVHNSLEDYADFDRFQTAASAPLVAA